MQDPAVAIVHVQRGATNDACMAPRNVLVSTPPRTVLLSNTRHHQANTIGAISPCVKDPAMFRDAAGSKRAKRSAIEKKSRQRRQQGLAQMHDHVKQLEQLFADLVKQRKRIGATSVVARSLSSGVEGSNWDQLQPTYSELTLAAHALEHDQTALLQLWRELDRVYSNGRRHSRRVEGVFDVWDSGVPPSSSFAATFRPLSMKEGYSIVRQSFEEIRKFTETENFETTGASFMGWVDKRKYDQKAQAMLYSFTKHFPFENPEHVFMKSWDAYLDGPKLEYFSFGRYAQSRFEVLQVLNNDLLVFRRDYRMSGFPITFTAIQIMFRLQTATGYSFCVRTIPSPEIEKALETHEYSFDVFHWIHFNRLYDEYDEPAGCEVAMAGRVSDQNQLKSNYWWFEIVCSVLRWESMIIAPVFLLQT